MFSIADVEEVCAIRRITVVMHPVIRRALAEYEESFSIGLRCFLAGELDGVYDLPLPSRGYVRLLFSRRRSPGGHPILRVDAGHDSLLQIRKAVGQSRTL